MSTSNSTTLGPLAATIMTLVLLATWTLTHHYEGLSRDGELYAFQAMAQINPALRHDVYLGANSQDSFSIFSPLYALLIRWLGLWNAGGALLAMCAATLYAATWSAARDLWDEKRAWLCTAVSISIVCGYGAYGVFHYAEAFLTARSMAEAMVIVSIACHLRGLPKLSWVVAATAILIHPLMALPGLLFLICISIPMLTASLIAMIGVLIILLTAWLALRTTHPPHWLAHVDGQWLEVVRERSQFLFLQEWRLADWEQQARPILCLSMATMTAGSPRVRRLCLGALLIGITGLLIALIASCIGPIAIILQGQAWRWFWLTGFVSVLVLAPTVIFLWKHTGCGSICAVLMVASWTFPPVNGTYLSAAALCLWCARSHLRPGSQKLLHLVAYCMIATILAWVASNVFSVLGSPPAQKTEEPLIIERLRSIYALQLPSLMIAFLSIKWLRSKPPRYLSGAAVALLVTLGIFAVPGSFRRNIAIGTDAAIASVSQWRAVISPSSNVLVVGSMKTAGFIWFSLQRPSYLTVSQSAGVVFSSDTALEIWRRSDVLLAIETPSWRIMSQLARSGHASKPGKEDLQTIPLTVESLQSICSDVQLAFVIAKESLPFTAVDNTKSGPWRNWKLYDCGQVRQQTISG